MASPVVSIVVPAHNAANFLRPCVDSILSQTVRDIELIIVDDGSTDSTGAISDEYAADPRVRVIHTSGVGVAQARNIGVQQASAPYLMFVDADDMVYPQIVEILLRLMRGYGCAAAVCGFTDKFEKMRVKGRVWTCTPERAIELTLYQRRGMNSSLCCKLFPTKAVAAAPQRPGMRFEDLDAIYRIYELLEGNVVVSSAPMYYYRPNESSFIHTVSDARLDVLKVTDDIERHYKGHPLLEQAAADRKFSANFNIFLYASKHHLPDVAAACWQIIRRYRLHAILNPKVRLKNKIGALLSYLRIRN